MTQGQKCRRHALFFAPIVVAGLVVSPGARAEDDVPVTLHWNVPADASCPTDVAVLNQIRDLIGPAEKGTRQPIDAKAVVKNLGPNRWELELTTRIDKTEGHRTLDGASCQSMVDATALILAWMVDPTAMAARSFPVPAPAPAPAPPAPVPKVPVPNVPPPEPTKPPPPRSPGSISAALGTVVDLGSLPRATLGIDAHGDYQPWRYLSADVRLSYFPHSVGTASDPSMGGTFSLFTGGAAVCAGPRVLALCLGPELDVMHGAGFGVRVDSSGTHAWLSLVTQVRGRLPITAHLSLTASAALVVPSERQTFALDGVGPVHRPSAVAGRGALGLELLF